MLILPAIDIIEGRCVRLQRGDYNQQKVYDTSPVEMAQQCLDASLPSLHVVDLEGAKAGRIVNWDTLRSLLSIEGLSVEVGGGVRTTEDVRQLFDLGAANVVVGSVAIQTPELISAWIEQWGAERIVLAMDVKQNLVAYRGWLEQSGVRAEEFIRTMRTRGAMTFLCTDIERDGMMNGPNIELYRQLINSYKTISVIASGGISSIADLREVHSAGCSAAIVGRALYEGTISLNELGELQQHVD